MAILINGVRQLYKPKIITYPDTTLFGEPSLIKFKDSNEAIHYLKGYYNGNFEYETMQYLSLPDVSLTQAQQAALDANIKSIKYGSGIVLSSLTAKLSLVSGYYFVTQSSVDLRPYALISGVQFSFSDGSKTAVYSGTMTAGTGEDISGGDILGGAGSFTSSTGWTLHDGWSIDSGVLTAASASGTVYYAVYNYTGVIGALYKVVIDVNSVSGAFSIAISGNPLFISPQLTATGSGQTRYATLSIAGYAVGLYRADGARTGEFDNLLFYKVLTPSTSGFLSSALTIESGFNPNAASFTVTITRP